MSRTSIIGRYGPCPVCGALNMAHRDTCYRCRKALPDSFWEAGGAKKPGDEEVPAAFHDARRCPRSSIAIPNVRLFCEGMTPQRVTIHNISACGLQFRAPALCRTGTLVCLELPMGGGRARLIEGFVRYAYPVFEEGRRVYTHGVEFNERNPLLHRLTGRL